MASAPVTTPPPPPQWQRRRRPRSMAGPIVLILLGVLFLLGSMHLIQVHMLGLLFARFWPLLLILWGVIKLMEYYAAQRGGYDAPGLGVGGVFFLIFLIGIGMSASAAARLNWGNFENNMDWSDGDNSGWFGNRYEFSDTLEQPLAPGGKLHINSNHGDVTVSAWDENKIKVVVNKKVVADSQDEANKINGQSRPTLSVEGNTATLTSDSSISTHAAFFTAPAVHTDLDIYLPRKAVLEVSGDHGDLKVTGRDGDLNLSHNHGDVALDDVNGNVSGDINHGDFSAHKITGNVSVEGRVGDSDLADVGGSVSLNGDYFGDVAVSHVNNGVRFESSRTHLQIGALAGDMRMDGNELRVENASGGFNVRTRSKDIHIENAAGDVGIQNSNGEVELHTGNQLGDVSITNRNGSIHLYVPPSQGFTVQASTRDGGIESDFDPIHVSSQNESATASGTVGSGGKRIQLSNEHSDIEIRRGVVMPESPAAPEAPAPPAPGKHPKAPKAPASSSQI